MKKPFHLKISTKVLVYFLLVSLPPLIIASALLVNSAKGQLLHSAVSRQQIIAAETASKVDNYLSNKINAVALLSQALSTNNLSTQRIDESMALLIHFDKDISDLYLLDTSGKQTNVFVRQGKVGKLNDMSNSSAYKFATYPDVKGKPFVGSVEYNSNNQPTITIAVPVIKSDYAQHLKDLNKANFGTYTNENDVNGVLVAHYNISELWQTVLSTKIGQGGYAYVVDSQGNLVAHPDKQFLSTHQKITDVKAVQNYRNGDYSTGNTISETGQQVVSTPAKITKNSWAVIVEEPVASIYSRANSYIRLSIIIILAAEIIVVVLGLIFRKQLIGPIRKLSIGAKQLGSGNFDYTFNVKSSDELQDLAQTFNKMSSNIKHLVNNLQSKNSTLLIEQTKLNSIISSVSDGIIALNSNGQIITVNPPAAALIKKKPQEIYGSYISSLYAWEKDNVHFTPELKKPGVYQYTNVVLPRGSDYLYLDLLITVLDRQDNEVQAIISIHDQTKARELDYMKLDFVAIAAHELRTPLTVIQGYLNLLNESAVRQLSIYNIENLQKAVTGSIQLRDLINKLLSISRIERGKFDVSIEKVNIVKLAEKSVKEQSSNASEKKQRLTLNNFGAHAIYAPADENAITEVLNNLIGNALKYSSEKAHVQVNIKPGNDEVRVEVVDNGPGIPTELRSRLFTKFYRAERSITAGSRGTGLGLYISKIIIERHGGKIGIEPDAGHGSTFYFTLPTYNPDKHDKLVSDKPTGGAHGWFKKHTDS